MTGRHATLRLFVAIYPPPTAAGDMAQLLPTALTSGHKPCPAEQLHLTLLFIGDIPARDLPRVSESVRRAASGLPTFALTPARIITLPQRGDPRLIALTTDAPSPLVELVRRLTQRLARNPRARSAGDYLPHITLCRFIHSPSAAVPAARTDRPIDLAPFPVTAVSLVHSTLRPTGAVHSTVAVAELSSPVSQKDQ